MFRIHRDTRFSKDKSPYKTAIGIQFRHELGKDAHAPGYYLHIDGGGCLAGAGMWHPDSPSLRKIREAIVEDPQAWKRTVGAKRFRDAYVLEGDRLKRAPRGFDPDHPLVEDLKRKDFIGVAKLPQKMITDRKLPEQLAKVFRTGTPLVDLLCNTGSMVTTGAGSIDGSTSREQAVKKITIISGIPLAGSLNFTVSPPLQVASHMGPLYRQTRRSTGPPYPPRSRPPNAR
jgi:uncharacterized protein (TIGR02453 family)